MAVLVTGGAGYIGSHTATLLIDEGHRITLYDDLSNSKIEVVDYLKKITGMSPHFVKGDIRDKSLLSDTLQKFKIEAVIHFAGLKAVGESVLKPIEYYANSRGMKCIDKESKFVWRTKARSWGKEGSYLIAP